MELQGNFEEKVLLTADGYIKKGRWNDAIHLVKYTEMVQESSPGNLTSLLISKILKDALSLVDLHKTLKVYKELKIILDEIPTVPVTDRCSVYNNMACTYRSLGNLIQGKKYAEKSISLALKHRIPFTDRVAFHINLISILSELQKYEKASEEAQKVFENFSRLSTLSEPMQKMFATVCFHYGNTKIKLNDPSEAIKYLKKSITLLEKLPELSEMLKEVQQLYLNVQKEVYRKPKSRPVSASLKQKLNNRLDFVRSKKSEYSIISYRKSNQNIRPVSGSRFINNEMVKYQKEIEKIISRPPLHNKVKVQNSQFRISSQTGIRILPSRPDSSNVYNFSPLSKVNTELSIETYQIACLSRAENSNCEQNSLFNNSFSSIEPASKTLNLAVEIVREAKEEKAALKIQSVFRGHQARKNKKTTDKCEIIYSGKRKIKNKQFFIIIAKMKLKIIMELLNLILMKTESRINLSPFQIKNIESLLNSLDLDPSGVPFLNEKGQNSCFKHVQRSVKKIGDENLILDCFSNETNEVLIKAKNFKSQKEFSVKVKRSSEDIKQEIEEKIIPKLRIKAQGLVLSESIDYLPELMYEGKKFISNEEFFVSVYLKIDRFIVVARDITGKCLEEKEVSANCCSKEQAEIVWKQVWVEGGKVVLNNLDEVCHSEQISEKFHEDEKNFDEIREKESEINRIDKESITNTEEVNEKSNFNEEKINFVERKLSLGEEKTSIINMIEEKMDFIEEKNEDIEEIQDNIERFEKTTLKPAEKKEEIIEVTDAKLEEIKEKNTEVTTEKLAENELIVNKNSFPIQKENSEMPHPETMKAHPQDPHSQKSKISPFFLPITQKALNTVDDVVVTESEYQDSACEVHNSNEDSLFEEKVKCTIESQIEISKIPFKVHCQVFDSFLQISVQNGQENQTVFLKSLIIEGYPEDCPLKRILIQYVFPRLYFKDLGVKKILTCLKKFLIDFSEIKLKPSLKPIAEFTKTLETQEYKIKVLKNKYFYIVLWIFNHNLQKFWLPFKETKNFTEESLLCRYISNNLDLINNEKFALNEVKGENVYSVFNYELSGLEFAIVVKKENSCCLVEAHRPKSKISCSLFIEGEKIGKAGVLGIAKSLRLIDIRGEYSLISDLV